MSKTTKRCVTLGLTIINIKFTISKKDEFVFL